MITGQVVAGREAVIPLTLRGTQGQDLTLDAVVDTGFTGFLTLPLPEIAQLGFPYQGLDVLVERERLKRQART